MYDVLKLLPKEHRWWAKDWFEQAWAEAPSLELLQLMCKRAIKYENNTEKSQWALGYLRERLEIVKRAIARRDGKRPKPRKCCYCGSRPVLPHKYWLPACDICECSLPWCEKCATDWYEMNPVYKEFVCPYCGETEQQYCGIIFSMDSNGPITTPKRPTLPEYNPDEEP